ncbi:universal stress protein [Corynebacterium sp. H128]|uniref:universal stress protein n=1 Tax=unclassified Corynebacterium TaxID=2624378 RepID=UPI00309DA497
MLVAFDGSEESKRALAYGAELLRPSHVQILTAWEPLHRQAARAAGGAGMMQTDFSSAIEAAEGDDPAYTHALETCQEGIALAESYGLEAHAHLVESSTAIWSALVDAAQELRPDVIVTGTRALKGIRSLFTSSTAENLVSNAGLPVLIVPPVEEELV